MRSVKLTTKFLKWRQCSPLRQWLMAGREDPWVVALLSDVKERIIGMSLF